MDTLFPAPLTLEAYTTHERGSWRWTARFAKVRYVARWSRRKQAWIWKRAEVLTTTVTPSRLRAALKEGAVFGGRHNRLVAPEEFAVREQSQEAAR